MPSVATQRGRMTQAAAPRQVRNRQVKALWGRAAGRCSFPGCRIQLVAPSESTSNGISLIGEQAHIVAHSDDSTAPRSDPSSPRESRDEYENLILLCPTHHKTVDQDAVKYDADRLREMKRQHESWVNESLKSVAAHLPFEELELVANQLLSAATAPSRELRIIPPHQKIQRNNLSDSVGNWIVLGLANVSLVEDYIRTVAKTDPKFPERLKAGFVNEYRRLRKFMSLGDELFFALMEFAKSGDQRFERQVAGLTILAYFFEKCEVLER